MNAGDSITAVIPVHNRADLLERLMSSIRAQTLPFNELIVVDNLSTDEAVSAARAAGARVISMGENAGFARAVNAGWRAATTRWIAILNSDVELDAHWVERLMAGVGRNSFATGLLLRAADDRLIDGTYDLVARSGCAWRAGHGFPAAGLGTETVPIAVAPGTACLFRRDVLALMGGYDETFGSYLEDVDLGLRCVRQGMTGVFVPAARALHHGSATLGRWNPQVVRLISRNQLLLVRRHYDRRLFRSCLWPIVTGQLLWGLVALRHGAFGAWMAGKREGLRGFKLAGTPSGGVRDFLEASETEIRVDCRDAYWRWYFRLTASAAN